TDQFLETEGESISLSCPFCLQMMEEGLGSKGVEDTKTAKDLLEIMDASFEGATISTASTSEPVEATD
ncbi:MAG: hypothetical protein VB824_09265, partial [Dehalococcoidia bacterium]